MSHRGRITSFEPHDAVGRITLDDGREVRFGASACVNLRPHVGLVVWVPELKPHALGGVAAVSVQREPDLRLSRDELFAARAAADQALSAKLFRSRGFSATFERPPPVRVPHADDVMRALGLRLSSAALARHERRLDLTYAPTLLTDLMPFDPCFVGFATDGTGASVGYLGHPGLAGRGLGAIVLCDRDGSLRFLAASLAELSARDSIDDGDSARAPADLQAFLTGDDMPWLDDGSRAERALVRQLRHDETAGTVLQEVLELQRRLGWPAGLIARTQGQIDTLAARTVEEAAIAAIKHQHWHEHPELYRAELEGLEESRR